MSRQGGNRADGDVAGAKPGVASGEVLERITDGFFAVDEQWRFTYVNGRAEELLGLTAEELIGENVWDRFTEATDLAFYEEYHAAMETQEPVSFTEYFPPLGSWFRVKAYPSASGLSVFFEDVTEQKQYEQVLDTLQDGVYVLDPDDEFVMVNDAFAELTGYEREELVGADASLIRSELLGERAREAARRIAAGEQSYETLETEIERKSGEALQIESRFTTYEYGDGSYGRVGVMRDVSDRVRREQALTRLQEATQRLPHATSREAIADELVAAATDALRLPGVAVYLHDRDRDELLPAASDGALSADRRELPAIGATEADSVVGRAFVDGETVVGEAPAPLANAPLLDVRRGLAVPLGREGVLVAGDPDDGAFEEYTVEFAELLAATAESELARLERESTLRERERDLERYKRIVETVDDGVYVVDEDGRFQIVNDAFLRTLNRSREELLGAPTSSVFGEAFVDRADRLLDRGGPDERDEATLEYERETGDGPQFLECRFAAIPEQVRGLAGRVCVVRDITEEKERESRLRDRVRQQRVAAAFGRRALQDTDVDDLLETAVTVVADALDVEYAKALDLQPGGTEFHLRAGVGWDDGTVGSATVGTRESSQAGFTLVSDGPVIVEDLAAETRFDGSDLLTDHDVTSGISVVVGSAENPWGVLGAHTTQAREFDRHDANFLQSVANTLSSAIERNHHEWALKHQGERLAALNHLNTIVREINHALAQQSSREEIESLVCSRLASSSSYEFAWIGDVDWSREVIRSREEVGVEGYLEGVTLPIDESEQRHAPAPQAIRTNEVQVARDFVHDDRYERWHDLAEEHGFTSLAAIPIHYEGTNHGVLCVYSERTDAFQGEELDVLEDLGEIIGHAIQSLERKRILLSDEVIELDVIIENALADVEGLELGETSLQVDRIVPTAEDSYLNYGTLSDPERLEEIVDAHPQIVDGDLLEGSSGRFVIEVQNPPAVSAVTAHGGRLRSVEMAGSDYRLSIELPPNVEARTVLEPLRETYSEVETVAQQHVTRDEHRPTSAVVSLGEELTDRQRAMLEAAYFGGYFEWPRISSAEEVADRMDVSAPTFHEHLRRAQRKVFEAMLEDA